MKMVENHKYYLIFMVLVCKDVSGAPPVFTAPNPDDEIPVAEGAAERTIYTVVASDNPNSVSYSILSQSPAKDPALFAIDEASGVLSTAVEIDYETLNDTERTVAVVVQATSSAAVTDTATISFTVTVGDANDNTPIFEGSPFCKTIASTAPAGTTVGTYTATDADITVAHSTISVYEITVGADSPPKFTIGETTAIIITTGEPLNASVTAEYQLMISASDGMNTGYGNVTVKLDGTCEDQQNGGNGAVINFLAPPAMIMHVFVMYL